MNLTDIKAPGARLECAYRTIRHDVFCLLPTSTINLGNGADANLFNLFSWKRSTFASAQREKWGLTVARNEKCNYRVVENWLLAQIVIRIKHLRAQCLNTLGSFDLCLLCTLYV